MAEVDRIPTDRRIPGVPERLLEELRATPVIRLDEVEKGRQHAAARTYEDGDVVVEIATQLLSLSGR